MDIKGLRIGNYLITNKGEINRVSGISDIHGIYRICPYETPIYDYAENFSPIPLTEEWDGKFKFKKTGYRLVCYENNKYIFEMTVEEIGGFSGRRKYFVPVTIVEYVHQVQNLYFALTNKELLIK